MPPLLLNPNGVLWLAPFDDPRAQLWLVLAFAMALALVQRLTRAGAMRFWGDVFFATVFVAPLLWGGARIPLWAAWPLALWATMEFSDAWAGLRRLGVWLTHRAPLDTAALRATRGGDRLPTAPSVAAPPSPVDLPAAEPDEPTPPAAALEAPAERPIISTAAAKSTVREAICALLRTHHPGAILRVRYAFEVAADGPGRGMLRYLVRVAVAPHSGERYTLYAGVVKGDIAEWVPLLQDVPGTAAMRAVYTPIAADDAAADTVTTPTISDFFVYDDTIIYARV